MSSAENKSETQTTERTPEEIRAEIEVAREELGVTVAKLAEKTDVKAQAKKKATETKEQAQQKANDAADNLQRAVEGAPQKVQQNPAPAAVVGAILVLSLVIWVARRRREVGDG